jgi:hypothetical protein
MIMTRLDRAPFIYPPEISGPVSPSPRTDRLTDAGRRPII